MKTASSNKKIRELIGMVSEGKLVPRPEFQRRLVWSRDDKNLFLDSVLRGYPFPEIYFADGDVDLETGEGTQLLVDGLQRVSTIAQYFSGDPELKLTTVKAYKDLSEDSKRAFLQYDVSVRDLGSLDRDVIIDVFRRINATKYSLLDIEINNAIYKGVFKQFAERAVDHPLFKDMSVFTSSDYKRMGDLRFGLLLVGTMMEGYFNRDDAFEELLARFNDDFPDESTFELRLNATLDFLGECGFEPRSRIWRKADLFTAIVEIDRAQHIERVSLQPSTVVDRIATFFSEIEGGNLDQSKPAGIYYKAALQASNDRVNRIRRGVIFGGKLQGVDDQGIMEELKSAHLL